MIDILEAKESSHIREIDELAYRIWTEHYTRIIGKTQVDYMLLNFQSAEVIKKQIEEGSRYFLVYHAGKAVGYFAILANQEDNSLFLSKLYVEKESRGNGIARLCLEYMEDICIADGLDRIWLTVNKYNSNSIKAYERLGFKKVEELVQNIGEGFVMDDYRMEKIIGVE